MNFLKQTLFIIVACLALQYFLPWWTLAIGAALGGYLFGTNGWTSFLSGFIGVGLLWLTTAMIIDMQTNAILTEKVAQLFPTKAPALLMVLTAVIGGVVGGFAGLTGSLFNSPRPR